LQSGDRFAAASSSQGVGADLIQPVLQPPYELAYDVSPERRSSIALSGRNQDDDWHVEIQESRQGTQWVPSVLI
jgi:hypothetical protein